jgi:hypothetical protein
MEVVDLDDTSRPGDALTLAGEGTEHVDVRLRRIEMHVIHADFTATEPEIPDPEPLADCDGDQY